MENIKEIICDNLIKLRKDKKLTQLELAEKINYSDKAVSHWEKGEAVPDVETLNKLSEFYEIPISYFFEKHFVGQRFKIKRVQIGSKTAISLMSVVSIWFIAAVIYTYIQTLSHINLWMIFVWAVPISFVVAIIFNAIWGERKNRFIYISLLIWTLLIAVYLQFLKYNLALIFIIGVPLQVGTALWSCITPKAKE